MSEARWIMKFRDQTAASEVRDLQYSEVTKNSINVTWTPPEFPNGPIFDYLVIYVGDDDPKKQIPGGKLSTSKTWMLIEKPDKWL